MRHLHVECIGGASGDMLLGALIELGVSAGDVEAALAGLHVGPFQIKMERAASMHITGVRASVVIEGEQQAGEPAEPLVHEHRHHDHDHDHTHDHTHDHDHECEHHHHHAHRALSEIEKMINGAGLSADVAAAAIRIFRALGEAESKIHGVPVEDIHFHEVGAADSIVDIVGCCWALDHLGIDSVSVGPLPLGHGVIRCAHGVYPNPAPATLELLDGMKTVAADEPFELVTPTGAALLAGWKTTETTPAGARIGRIAYSIGRRKLNHRPNVLRATLFDTADGDEHDTCLVMECNLDDTTPELIGMLIEDLMAAGALDVTCEPVTMKKQRPGIRVSVLCEFSSRDSLLDLIFRGTTTFGVREYTVNRTKLSRRMETVRTVFGDVKVKIGTWRGEDITKSPEISDCRRIALENKVSVRAVYEAALKAM